jgi:hypothetical protein
MIVGNDSDRMKSKFRGSILRKPKKSCCNSMTVNEVLVAVILVDFEEKLYIAVEYKSLILCLFLRFCSDHTCVLP